MTETGHVRTSFAPIIANGLVLFTVLGMALNVSAENIDTSDMIFSDANPSDGDVITISVTVHNKGSFPVSNVTLSFYCDYVEIGNITGIVLGASSSSYQGINWTAEGGTHTISAMLSINGTPLSHTETSSEIGVALGDPNTLIGALILIVTVVFITPLAPSIFEKLKGQNSGRKHRMSSPRS